MATQLQERLTAFGSRMKKELSELYSLKTNIVSDHVVGLAISTDYVKLLKIKPTSKQNCVESFAFLELTEGLVNKNEITDPAAMAKILKDLFQQARVFSKSVALCIPRASTIVKSITVDSRLTNPEIESRVWIEANRLFPNLIDDIYLDFVIAGAAPNAPNQNEVLIVACRKEQVKSHLETMRLAGFNVSIIDVNSFALERASHLIAQQSPESQTFALLNVGFSNIGLIVMNEGKAIYTHELGYDGSALKQLKQAQNNDTQLNETLKHSMGLQLRHVMQFFYSSRPNIRIEKITLAGTCVVMIPGLVDFVKSEIRKEVELANPFKNMTVAKSVDKTQLDHYAPAMMLCCGLALSKSAAEE